MDVCSPSAAKTFQAHNTCFSKDALKRIAEIWNSQFVNNVTLKRTTTPSQYGPIAGISRKSSNQLWHDINLRMTQPCKGSGREWCWVDKLGSEAKSTSIISGSLRPQTPREWYDAPYTWLSNYDIAAVMKQYEADKSNTYKFLGVFPIDFTSKDSMGKCMYTEICNVDVSKCVKSGIQYIGLITNLDKHDEPGSHWTSTFICINPKMKCYGAYYYDSVSRAPPQSVKDFMIHIKNQLPNNTTFKIDYSKQAEQKGNTECGMFSMVYQMRWLQTLKKTNSATVEDVLRNKLNDEYVHKLRKKLFRPNTSKVVK